MVWDIVFVNGPEENKVKPMPTFCFCTQSLGKQSKHMRNLLFCNAPQEHKGNLLKNHGLGNRFVNGPKENRVTPIQKFYCCTRSLGKQRKHMRHLHFCNGPSENKGNQLKIMVWEIVFVNGPEKNRVKPIPKCCFCTRSLGKQSKNTCSIQFLSTVLRKTEETY